MKQKKTIELLKQNFHSMEGLKGALLYGSFGRNNATPNSDIDIQLIVGAEFRAEGLAKLAQTCLGDELIKMQRVALRNKVVFYSKNHPKVEFTICTSISEINRNYAGSEIEDVATTVLYKNIDWEFDLLGYLQELTQKYQDDKKGDLPNYIAEHIDKFLYEFESCSSMQRRSDGYQFYYFYNIAFHVAVQLHHLSKGYTEYNFLPKFFNSNILERMEQDNFYGLNGTLFLPEANSKKRALLTFFYESIVKLVTPTKFDEIKVFCDWIYNRDFFWNFRDVNQNNPMIAEGKIFRTATMTLFQDHAYFDELLQSKNIKTVIDLRADREVEELPYSSISIDKFRYVRTPLDPWNQPDWFKEKYHYGTDEEIAYRFFVLGCKDQIRTAIEAILSEQTGAAAVHCFAGKDRTGIFISMLHLLIGTPLETIYADYLASENDIKKYRLDLVLDLINEAGGINDYLLSCGLTDAQLSDLKLKLLHG